MKNTCSPFRWSFIFVCAICKDSSMTTGVCVLWTATVDCWGWGQMAPGWVRISQLHMKAKWPKDGGSREGMTDCVDGEGSELACFDPAVDVPNGSVHCWRAHVLFLLYTADVCSPVYFWQSWNAQVVVPSYMPSCIKQLPCRHVCLVLTASTQAGSSCCTSFYTDPH